MIGEDKVINRINQFLENHVFQISTQPFHYLSKVITNVKIKITGIKNYINVGEESPHIEYTIYILNGDPTSNQINLLYKEIYGEDVKVSTTDNVYSILRWAVYRTFGDFLRYFGRDENIICTRVVNQVQGERINEGLLKEDRLDKTTRILVKDIISIFKHQREGEWELPEDLSGGDVIYDLPGFEGFNILLDLKVDENIEDIDVDGDLYFDDDLVVITIISNPKAGYSNLDILTRELNEVVRHELEHIKQYHQGTKSKTREIKSPEKYYTQKDELEAQLAGFRKRAKSEKGDLETIIRDWFKKYSYKHKLKPEAMERVIQKILNYSN